MSSLPNTVEARSPRSSENDGPPLSTAVRAHARKLRKRADTGLEMPDRVLDSVAQHAPDEETAAHVLDLAWHWARVPWWALEEIGAHDGDGLAVAVYVAVRSFADFDGEEARRPHRAIARRAGCSRDTAKRRLRDLRSMGVVGWDSGQSNGRPNLYSVPLDPPAEIDTEHPELFARVPTWALELIAAVEDGELRDPDGPEDREQRVRADGGAVAALTALRKHVEFTPDGEPAEYVPPTSNKPLRRIAGLGKNRLTGRLLALRRMGVVSWPERTNLRHAHQYRAPIYPRDFHIPYLVVTHEDNEGNSAERGQGVALSGDRVVLSGDRGSAERGRTKSQYREPFSESHLSDEGADGADEEETNSERGQRRKETEDLSPTAESVSGRTTGGRSAAADAQKVRRRIREYCREHGHQIPTAEALDRVAPAVVEAADPLDDDPGELLPDLLEFLAGSKGRRRTPHWPDFLDLHDAADGKILAHVAAHARAWARERPDGADTLADASLRLETAVEAMLMIPAEKAEKWAGLVPEMQGLEVPARVYHPETVERAGGGDSMGGDLKGLFPYAAVEIGAVEAVEVHEEAPQGMTMIGGHAIPVD